MAVVVRHTVTTGAPADPRALVDGPAWDAAHVVTGLDDEIASFVGPTLQMFGADPSFSDNMPYVRLAAAYCNSRGITTINVPLSTDAFVCTTYADSDQASLADITFTGNGSLTGVYRKRVIPTSAPSDALDVMDLIPEIHLGAMNRAGASPKIAIVGDSTATYLANSVGRQALIVEAVKRKITEEFATPTFVNLSLGGRVYGSLMAAVGETNDWATDATKVWLSYYVKNAAPDVIVFDFGMNDSSSVSYGAINAIFTEVNTWTKIPDVVFCTNSVPSLAWPGSSTKAMQEGRDAAAGLTRTVAQYNRKGLLDFHRQFCMARDGFDPLSSALKTGNSVTVSGGACTGTTECWDFKANIHFNGTAWTAGSGTDFLVVKTGTGSADFMQITKSAGGFFTFALFGGDLGDSILSGTATTAKTIPTTNTAVVVEKFGNRLTVYLEDVAFGTNTEPLFSSQVVAKGGRYFPSVTVTGTAGLSSVDFSYGEPRYNKPSATNTKLLGDTNATGVPYGGFGGNHPTSVAFTNVYWPIIGQSRWAGASMIGPASSTDSTPAVFDGPTGRFLKNISYAAFKALLFLVKGDVGLGNVDNTSDANKPVSTAQATAIALKAPVASPTFTGTASAPNFVASASPGTAPQFDASSQTVTTVANGASAAIAGTGPTYGLLIISDINVTASRAVFLLGASGVLIVAQSGAEWVVGTTPAAGKMGIGFSGTEYRVYNNQGASVNFKAAYLRVSL